MGKYRHFKGGIYEVIETIPLADGEELETLVIYKNSAGDKYARTEKNFNGTVERDGTIYHRFEKIPEPLKMKDVLEPWATQVAGNWIGGNCHTVKNYVTVPEANLYTIEDQLQRMILSIKEGNIIDTENLQEITNLLREVRLGK